MVNFVQKLETQTGSADPAILFSLGFPKVQQAGLIIFNASILEFRDYRIPFSFFSSLPLIVSKISFSISVMWALRNHVLKSELLIES